MADDFQSFILLTILNLILEIQEPADEGEEGGDRLETFRVVTILELLCFHFSNT